MSVHKGIIYLDCAATTPLDEEVLEAMMPYLKQDFGNASSSHTMGHTARQAIDRSRKIIADALNCSAQELIFTAGGTESDNIALFGAARYAALQQDGPVHIITTAIEHAAVLEPCRKLEKEGLELTVVPVQKNGIVDVQVLIDAIQENTVLVSVIMANNEIGTIQPITELTRAIKEKNPDIVVHTDACQATRSVQIDVQELGVDLLTLNAGKVYGPKGIGALYIKKGVQLEPIIYGGGHEQGLRPGTENVAGIVGFAKAVELAEQNQEQDAVELTQKRDRLIHGLLQAIPDAELNGDQEQRLPNNVNIFIPHISGEVLLMHLDEQGVQASLGSACEAGSLEPSHVILALGRSKQDARRCLRLTLGKGTTDQEVDQVLEMIPSIIKKIQT